MAPAGCLVFVAAAGYGKTTALEGACVVVRAADAGGDPPAPDLGVDDACRLTRPSRCGWPGGSRGCRTGRA
ncbi:hypothetical protein [Phytohabitans kaempferiae]|uniref:Uncharacterized protein n=1 Tax=Phytohabitans kaempferiae TaxID=1620943 RepID=A0ABV6MEC1_9ACTN